MIKVIKDGICYIVDDSKLGEWKSKGYSEYKEESKKIEKAEKLTGDDEIVTNKKSKPE